MKLNQKKIQAPSLVLPLLLLGVAGDGPLAMAQAPGTFTTTGSMTTVREAPTATLLPSGKVLIAGGTDGHFTIGSAELYDPRTGTFTATGSMTTPRAGHTATLLANGRVLITGGVQTLVDGPGSTLSSAEIYDPATETFAPTGNMSVGRGFHTATLLANGKVLIAGGSVSARPVELYDAPSGTFTTTTAAPPTLGVGSVTVTTLLTDGAVFFPRSLLKISMECRNTRILGDGKPSPSARRPLTERFCALRFLADSRRSVFQQAPRGCLMDLRRRGSL